MADFEAVAPHWAKARQELVEGLKALFECHQKARPVSAFS